MEPVNNSNNKIVTIKFTFSDTESLWSLCMCALLGWFWAFKTLVGAFQHYYI